MKMVQEKELITVRPGKSNLVNLLEDINKGRIKIPIFQRDFIWEEKQMLELFDSIEKGYPIGSLIFWKPEEEYDYFEEFGPYKIKTESKDLKYVLDGYQRLSTLFGVLTNPKKYNNTRKANSLRDYNIYYDLENEKFTYDVKGGRRTWLIPFYHIPLHVLIDTFYFLDFSENLRNKMNNRDKSNLLINRARKLAKKLLEYEIAFIDIKGGDIKSSVEIFYRVNSKGTQISVDWMLSALSYVPRQFLLTTEISNFLLELEEYNFENLDRDIIINCVAASTNEFYKDIKIEDLARRSDFPTLVKKTLKNIKKAIQFLNEELNVIEYKLIPHDIQLIFLSEFFRLNPENELSEIKKQELIRWFWFTSYNRSPFSFIPEQYFFIFRKFARSHKQEIKPSFYINRISFNGVFLGNRRANIIFLLKEATKNKNEISSTKNELHITYIIPDISIMSHTRSIPRDRSIANTLVSTTAKLSINEVFSSSHKEQKYFINEKIIQFYKEEKYEEVLAERTKLIQEREKQFIESLGFLYSSDEE